MSNNGPSNIRINPFVGSGGATTYVNLTETHIIPSVSPFVIRLNEVPEKRDPSNMKCVYVDDTTGAVTSRALTEVAATPAAGQFRPDYSTKVDKDDSWNTGLIEFNSADAGKIVQITYTGMGTLAAVQSNKYPSWYTDRGDGSDGDFIPSENTTIGGVKNYKRVFIKEGVTITVDKYVKIKCQGAFVNKGVITADGAGGVGGAGGVAGNNNGSNGEIIGSGASNGGAGGKSTIGSGGAGGAKLNSCTDHSFVNVLCGGGGGGGATGAGMATYNGGAGGAGGGDINIIAKSFTNSNNLTAKGLNGSNASNSAAGGGGGGGGGRIMIIANTFTNTGNLNISGGAGGAGGKKAAASGDKGILYTKQLGVL